MNERILVVDDDPGLSEVLALLLDREGYVVENAGTVKAAFERLGANPDLVITDLKLPDGTGLDVIAGVRARRPRLPIIMITSYSSMESAIEALRAGASDYVIKPFKNEELLRAISRALSDRRTVRGATGTRTGSCWARWPPRWRSRSTTSSTSPRRRISASTSTT